MSSWMDMFLGCYTAGGEVNRIAWPDGGCYLEQDYDLNTMFSIIRDEILKRRQKING